MADKLENLNNNLKHIPTWLDIDTAPWVIAGPCSAESADQIIETALALEKSPNVKVFRAGIWKPRTRPDTFEGVGPEGLEWLKLVKQQTRLLTTTEVATARHVELCLEKAVDILWIGARTTVNPFGVQEIAEALRGVDVPVMVKNPINPELGLWLGAIERLYQAGITKLAAIHRGFSGLVQTDYRNRPTWQIPIELKRCLPALPLICDPSHIAGRRDLVERVSQMALDFGITGLMVESHPNPDLALSDSDQQITPSELIEMLDRLKVRQVETTDPAVRDQIEYMRTQISRIDSQLIADLAERMKWVDKIGRLKRDCNVPVLQLNRWEYLLEDHLAQAREAGLEPAYVKAVFELIHANAVKKQL
ncbi:MAG: bifunctional 3-deoxy-7-phosphoheptulonate synthase/chorismate mutase type II [Sedimentisphaerales bacterium]|nr:bifunctional 3-deoxy-7-phosphoheptulonate synthase/chorismate mutase type II [Sedimentisphaerales bacterium]